MHSLPANPLQVCCYAQEAGEAAARELTDIKCKLGQVSAEATAFASAATAPLVMQNSTSYHKMCSCAGVLATKLTRLV